MTTKTTFVHQIEEPNGHTGMKTSKEEMEQGTAGRNLRILYMSVVISLLMLGGITFVAGTLHKITYPFGWDDDEGAVWWEAAHVTHLSILYHPIQQYPYFVVPYPPVFQVVTWLAARGSGNYLIAGRLVCFFSAMGISILIALLAFHATPRRIPFHIRGSGAAIACLLCFRLDSLSLYIPEMGVDLLALFLSFLGVYLFLQLRQQPIAPYAAFACFIAAVFTKQTMVAGPLACLIVTALVSIRKATLYLLFCVTLGTLTLGYLAWASGGEALRHLFIYNARQPFSITHWLEGMQDNFDGMMPIVTVACLAFLPIIYRIRFWRRGSSLSLLRSWMQSSLYRQALLVLSTQLVIAIITSLTYGKMGSGVHYFLEWNLLCCPLAGLLFVRVLNSWRLSLDYSLGSAAVLILIFFAALTGVPQSLHRIDGIYRLSGGERRLQDARYSSAAEALKVLEQTPGPALSDNLLLLMKAHKGIPIEPGIPMYLSKAGIWDQSRFVAMIDSRRFRVIVMRTLDNGFWTDEIVQAIEKNYVPTEHIGDVNIGDCYYTVYRPRRDQH